jgi:hypothetical protein
LDDADNLPALRRARAPPADSSPAQAKTLFGSPAEDKQKCAIQNNNRGWVGERAESLDPKTQKVVLEWCPL